MFFKMFFVILNCLVFFTQARGPNPEKAGWEPEGWGPKTRKSGGPKGGRPKISLFFSLSRHKIRSFLPSLGLLVEFWWCLKRRGSNVHVWSSLVVV